MKRSLGATALLLPLLASVAGADSIALVGATLHPISSEPIENGILILEGDRIVALGKDIDIPPNATVVDVAGKHIYPSLVHPGAPLGLTEISSVRGTRDTHEIGDINANIRAEVAFNADSMLLPVALSGGVLISHVVPQGGVLTGTSAIMRLDGWNWRDMTVASSVGMHLRYPSFRSSRRRSQEQVDKEKKRALEVINKTFDDARAYAKAKEAAGKGGATFDTDSNFEALIPVLDGRLALHIHAREKAQIESALDWAAEQELDNIVLVTGPDAQYVATRLAEEEVPVILDGVLEVPSRDWEPYDAAYTAAARLHEAGVKFCIGDGGDASNARNLPFHASMAAAFGLPKDEAIKSVTLYAAEILGVADDYGSLEAGKEATFIVTSGDPLEILSRVERAWMAGRELDLNDRQKELFEKYNSRPREPEITPRG